MVKHDDDDEMKIYTAAIDGTATHEVKFKNRVVYDRIIRSSSFSFLTTDLRAGLIAYLTEESKKAAL